MRHVEKAKLAMVPSITNENMPFNFIEIENAQEKQLKVFLGGTCNNSTWREELIPELTIPYFNPVVEDWTPECQEEERKQKEICGIEAYVITSNMTGSFSIAEVIDAAHRNPKGTVFYVHEEGFSDSQIKSFQAISDLVTNLGGSTATSLYHCASIINEIKEGFAPSVKFTIQSDPISMVGINGCQVVDMLEYTKCLFQSLNDVFPCRENTLTITKIEEALHWQEARTKDRLKRKVEGENKA